MKSHSAWLSLLFFSWCEIMTINNEFEPKKKWLQSTWVQILFYMLNPTAVLRAQRLFDKLLGSKCSLTQIVAIPTSRWYETRCHCAVSFCLHASSAWKYTTSRNHRPYRFSLACCGLWGFFFLHKFLVPALHLVCDSQWAVNMENVFIVEEKVKRQTFGYVRQKCDPVSCGTMTILPMMLLNMWANWLICLSDRWVTPKNGLFKGRDKHWVWGVF